MQSFAFAAQNHADRNFEIHFGVPRFGAFVEAHQPVARLFHFLHRARKIFDARNRKVRKRPGRRARDAIGKPGGAAFRNDDALRTGGQRCSHDRAKILRVLDAVEKNQQAGSAVRIARLQQVFKTCRRRCRNQRDDALMLACAGGAIELYALLKAHGNAVLPRQTHQFFDAVAVAASRDDQGIERPVGFERFAYGVNAGKTVP